VTFAITGSGWLPGGTVTSALPYGSQGWFTGYQTPTADAAGHFSYSETVSTGPSGATPPGGYPITYGETYGGCSLSFTQTFTVTQSSSGAGSSPGQSGRFPWYCVTGPGRPTQQCPYEQVAGPVPDVECAFAIEEAVADALADATGQGNLKKIKDIVTFAEAIQITYDDARFGNQELKWDLLDLQAKVASMNGVVGAEAVVACEHQWATDPEFRGAVKAGLHKLLDGLIGDHGVQEIGKWLDNAFDTASTSSINAYVLAAKKGTWTVGVSSAASGRKARAARLVALAAGKIRVTRPGIKPITLGLTSQGKRLFARGSKLQRLRVQIVMRAGSKVVARRTVTLKRLAPPDARRPPAGQARPEALRAPDPWRAAADRPRGGQGRGAPRWQVPVAQLRPDPDRRGHRARLQAAVAGQARLARDEDDARPAARAPPQGGPHPRLG